MMLRISALPKAMLLCTVAAVACRFLGAWTFNSPPSELGRFHAHLDDFLKKTRVFTEIEKQASMVSAPFAETENVASDAIARIGRRTPPNPNLVFLAMDNDSISIDNSLDGYMTDGPTADPDSLRALKLIGRGWPWSREVYGLILKRLTGAGAKLVIFDLNFPTASPDDSKFKAALDQYGEHVVLGANFSSSTPRAEGVTSASFTRPAETLIPSSSTLDPRVAIDNFWPDTDLDDVIRSAQFRVTLGQVLGGVDQEGAFSMAALAAVKTGAATYVPAGFDPHRFRFTGPAGTFPVHSIFEIFAPDYWQHNYANGDFFRGKIVVIGGYGNWQHDEHPTPFGSMPGPELHLQALNALLHREFLRQVPLPLDLLLIAVAGLLPLLTQPVFRSIGLRIAAGLLFNIAWLAAAWLLFNNPGLIIPVAFPLGICNFNGVLGLVYDVIESRRESSRIRKTLERYVSRNVVREMLDDRGSFVASLGGVVKPATILFSDIRNFTKVSAILPPQELVTQLNEYLSAMVQCVFQFDGTLDKFMGDAVMAVWGNAHTDGSETDARNALRAAMAMQRKLQALNAKWQSENRPQFKIGIALNFGMVIVGNVGSPHRMEYTVIGDAVNTGWHLQELTRDLDEDLIFGESVAEYVRQEVPVRGIGEFVIRKSNAMVQVFTIGNQSADDDAATAQGAASETCISS